VPPMTTIFNFLFMVVFCVVWMKRPFRGRNDLLFLSKASGAAHFRNAENFFRNVFGTLAKVAGDERHQLSFCITGTQFQRRKWCLPSG